MLLKLTLELSGCNNIYIYIYIYTYAYIYIYCIYIYYKIYNILYCKIIYTMYTPGLSMNILHVDNKSPMQQSFFTNVAGNLLPALEFLGRLYNFCNLVIIFSLI